MNLPRSHLYAYLSFQSKDEDEEFDDPARAGHPLLRCFNVVEDLLSMQEAEPFSKPARPAPPTSLTRITLSLTMDRA